ncbi:pyridoxal phosphate-dependent aminotransferase [Mesorhizobium sp.]|uniref:pyridoxal phosphate-dependent aminotransferase n=1 Tax=Mesorhizobium sp. TaxID=1871066 RepID=UPI000FE4C734|nr:pyridoxal phosphate-dependent aminotransferase [Mesorhizobium sp.]RWP26226.1 MAG: pyridoxal phosphate-dependent aminotransferase [Mesorhizobium sp.]
MGDATNPVASIFRPSQALSKVGPSAITRITAATAELRRQGRRIASMHLGEPDFMTPENIVEAAIRAMRAGDTHYTELDGTPEVKSAVLEKFSRENGVHFEREEIVVTSGAKMLLFSAFFATLNPGDEVILPAPYWGSYGDIVEMMGARAVVLPTHAQDGFKLRAEDLERAITPNTRWLLINSPSNPSGAVYRKADYEPILEVIERHPHVWFMIDDMYEHIIFHNEPFVTPAQLRPDLRGRILTINGVSKAYAMTGWRIGYAGGPAPLINAIKAVLSQSTSCPCSIAQAAAAEALRGPQNSVRRYLGEYRTRRHLVMAELSHCPGLKSTEPDGTFYAFVDWRALIGTSTPRGKTLTDDDDLCQYFLQDCGVSIVPGMAFGNHGFFRISFASSEADLRLGMARIREGCAALI